MDYFNLNGKTAVVLGIANRWSIAYAIAQALQEHGVRLAVTYQNERIGAEVRKLTSDWSNVLYLPCELTDDAQIDTTFAQIKAEFGQLNHLIHCIAFADRTELQGEFRAISRSGFHTAMDISAYSLTAVAQRAAPLMPADQSSILTLTYMASERVVPNYNVMGPVKAALESAVRYLAAELGPKGIRVHAISPGPLKTRAASGITDFDELIAKAQAKAPARSLVSIEDVGAAVAFLSMNGAKLMTGETLYVDGGYHIID
jgi:enoyl-[acyl-carrier protein] reductase I